MVPHIADSNDSLLQPTPTKQDLTYQASCPRMVRMSPRSLDDAPYDVLFVIFQCLQPSPPIDDDIEDQSTPSLGWLLNIALSCKSLSTHALDTLWHALPSDEPLLRLLEILDLKSHGSLEELDVWPPMLRSVRYHVRVLFVALSYHLLTCLSFAGQS